MLVTVSDKKLAIDDNADDLADYFTADVVTATDYFPFGMAMPNRKYTSSNGYRYGFNGQENSDEIAAGLTTALYWEYDSRIGRRWNVDPKPTIGISEYSCFFSNPLINVDIFGDDPSPKEAAKMADHVYATEYGKLKPGEKPLKNCGGWELNTTLNTKGITLTDPTSSFNSAIYQRKTGVDKKGNNVYEYAYVTAGTSPTSRQDWVNNALQAAGKEAPQYRTSVNNAITLHNGMLDKVLTFVGHSLGGGEASANSLATGRNGITFNAAGLSQGSRRLYALNRSANIQAYVVNGEAVSVAQSLLGLKAEGKIHKLNATYIPLLWFYPPPIRTAVAISNTVLSLYNHTMGSVLSKMEKQGIN